MKKLFAILELFAVVLSLSACTTKVAGKTFVYDELEIKWTDKVDEDKQESITNFLVKMNEDAEITFNEDGTCTLGTYTQDGSKVLVGDVEYTAKGGKLTYELDVTTLDIDLGFIKISLSDYAESVTVVYKVKK